MSEAYWRDGAATELGVSVFTEGDCWVLAYRLWQLTDWPVVRVGPTYDSEFPDAAAHYAVRAPSGHLLDVQGVSTRYTVAKRWDESSVVLAGPDFYEFVEDAKRIGHSEFPKSWPRSLVMARRLLDIYGVRA